MIWFLKICRTKSWTPVFRTAQALALRTRSPPLLRLCSAATWQICGGTNGLLHPWPHRLRQAAAGASLSPLWRLREEPRLTVGTDDRAAIAPTAARRVASLTPPESDQLVVIHTEQLPQPMPQRRSGCRWSALAPITITTTTSTVACWAWMLLVGNSCRGRATAACWSCGLSARRSTSITTGSRATAGWTWTYRRWLI